MRQRLIQLVIVVLAVTLLTFTFLRLLPGDPAISIAGIGANEQQLAEVRHRWGLDQPIPVQYVKWLGKMLRGDLGISSAYNVKVTTLVSQRLPVTLYLMFYAMLISLVVAIPLGIWTAYRANRPSDRIVSTVSFGSCRYRPTSSACCSSSSSPCGSTGSRRCRNTCRRGATPSATSRRCSYRR